MNPHKLVAQLVLAVVCGCLMTGCNSSPSAENAENSLRQQIESESQGQIKLLGFKKTDGQMSVVNAVKHYEFDYEAEIEFEASGIWLGKDILNHSHDGLTFSFHLGQISENSFEQLNNSIAGGVKAHRGDHVKIAGVMQGEKKESGWVFQMGDSHVVSGPINPAMQETQKKAENGDENAEADLGEMYYMGQGVDKDYVKALEWWQKAAAQGNVKGQTGLGVMLVFGLGTQKNSVEGIQWIRKAADAGYSHAQFDLGFYYLNGEGVNKDATEAMKWIRKAADARYSRAQYNLGLMFLNGEGVTEDITEAMKWLQKAAEQDDGLALLKLGDLTWAGYGVTKNYDTAMAYYRKAAKAGNKEAQDKLSKIQKDIDEHGGGVKEYILRSERIGCANNLKEIGIAFTIWAGDHQNRFPFDVSTNEGGTKELCIRGSDGFDKNSALHFQVMSNELATTKLLMCPSDSSKSKAHTFTILNSSNISYEINSSANPFDGTKEILVRCPVHGSIIYNDGSIIESPTTQP